MLIGMYGKRLIRPMMIFFFQAEDGIRDIGVTGVQTCALPISCEQHSGRYHQRGMRPRHERVVPSDQRAEQGNEIGRASCKGKSVDLGGGGMIRQKMGELEKG